MPLNRQTISKPLATIKVPTASWSFCSFWLAPVRDQIHCTKRAFAQLFLHLAKQQDRVLWVDILGPVLGKVPPDDILIQQLEMANPLQHEDTKKVVNSLNPSEMF